MASKVGVIGLGDIGAGVAANFERAGFELSVCDVRTEATALFEGRAHIAANPAELPGLCEVVVVAVVNDAQLESVVAGPEGVLAGITPGAGAPQILVLSTVGIKTVRRMAESASAAGSELVDCGVSGGPVAAAEGKLVAMVGGTDEAVERVRPVVEAFASVVLHMGPAGTGLQAKLARNIVQYGSWLAAFEGQRLAEAAGIELAKLAQAIRESDAMIGGASRLMFRETVEPFDERADHRLVDAMRAGANLAHKDLRAALELAGDLGVALPLTELTEELCDPVFGLCEIPAVFRH
jgi:3-hydroxyisobutyrate dehydrogenase-like beta-hydroxyacid dehydrogenase